MSCLSSSCIVIFLLSFIILLAFHFLVYRPLHKITEAATQYASGNLEYEIPVTTEDEMGYLSASLNYMSSQLRDMEANGLVHREVYAEVPPRVEYCLTERGLSLIPHLEGLVNWALQQMPGIMESREKNDSVQKPM